MINDVLDLSRIESGNLRLQTDTLNLPELVEATVAMVASDAAGAASASASELGARHLGAARRRDAGQADPHQPAQQRRQVQQRRRPRPRGQPAGSARRRRDRGHRHRPGHDARADGRAVPALQPARPRAHRAAGHRHRPRDQPAPRRADGRLDGGQERRRARARRSSSRCRGRSIPTPSGRPRRRSTSAPAEYHRRIVHYVEDNETNVEVMRGILAQRPQVQMEVSVTGLDGLAAIRAQRRRPDPARHAPARHQRPRAAAPPEGRPGDSGDPGGRRLGRRPRASRSTPRSRPAPSAT